MRYSLVYDSDCGPCTTFREVVGFLDARKAISFEGLAEADARGALDSLPAPARLVSFHLVSPDGIVTSGAQALPELAALLPGGRFTSRALENRALGRASRFAYSALSRLHGVGSCSPAGAPATRG